MVGMGWDRRVGRVLKDHTNTEWLGWDGLGVLEGSLKITEPQNHRMVGLEGSLKTIELQNGWVGMGWVGWKGP